MSRLFFFKWAETKIYMHEIFLFNVNATFKTRLFCNLRGNKLSYRNNVDRDEMRLKISNYYTKNNFTTI